MPAAAPPAPVSAPPSPEECGRLVGPVPEASGGNLDPGEIVYLGECNYGVASIRVMP